MTISESIRARQRAIIPYVTAGLPDLDTTGRIILALADAGAAAIEIGIPFSDPMADGPVLQQASKLAIDAGFKMDELFKRLPAWSAAAQCPLVVMSYINPLMRHGLETTLQRFKDCGVAGVIIPDEPSDASEVFDMTRAAGLDLIRLMAPTTPPQRLKEILSQCSGFAYAVALKGVTGARSGLPESLPVQIAEIKSLTGLPVCVGFGVSSSEQVDAILNLADGVIVGSHLVDNIMRAADPVAVAVETFKAL